MDSTQVTRQGANSNMRSKVDVRKMTVTAMLSAVAFVLMFLDTAVPIMPSFIKLDLSELPALMASFALGPVWGIMVCLIKNILHLTMTQTGGVGELSNFILGVSFVLPAGLIYQHRKTKKSAIIGAVSGALVMAVISFPSNLYIVYPFYYNFISIAENIKRDTRMSGSFAIMEISTEKEGVPHGTPEKSANP